jgi:tetratricopeptide (TPR) repeat protein
MDQHQEAIADFDLAISMDPRNYLFYNGKGVSQNALQRYQEAIINYTTCISLNPKFGQAYYNRAYSKFYGLKDQQGACEDWQMAAQYKYGQSEKMLAEFCQPAGQVKK